MKARNTYDIDNAECCVTRDGVRNICTDAVIVGTGASGLYTALNLPQDMRIVMISKADFESSDSFLAQGGICVLRDDNDYDSFFEDTMKAGHYENREECVDIMIRGSRDVIEDLIGYGVDFQHEKHSSELAYTREGAHSKPRILYHEDITGKEITSKLLEKVKTLSNVQMFEYVTMTDIIIRNGVCAGITAVDRNGKTVKINATYTVLATGGIGGNYRNSTNFRHLTGDAIDIARKHDIRLEHLDYVQIHPTTLFSEDQDRRFLISESVRGEGAILLDKNGDRFVDELLPRDVVTEAIHKQMEKDGTDHVWLSMKELGRETIMEHFPNIYQHCLEKGYDATKDLIPVVPAQHYFMGGVWVDSESMTSMNNLYAVGETSCNGVHGKNRLASNSLLEGFVFSKRAARRIAEDAAAGACAASV